MNRSIEEILPKSGDSCEWKTLLKEKELIRRCVVLGENKSKQWVGKGEGPTSKNIFQTLRRRGESNALARLKRNLVFGNLEDEDLPIASKMG